MSEAERKFRFLRRCIERRCKDRDQNPPSVFLRCKPIPRPYRKAGGTANTDRNQIQQREAFNIEGIF